MNTVGHKLLMPLLFVICFPLTVLILATAIALAASPTPIFSSSESIIRIVSGSLGLVPLVIIIGILAMTLASFVQMLLENLGLVRSEDTWQDWRSEPLDLPPGTPTGKALDATSPRLLERDSWPRRSRLVKYHRPARAKHYRCR